MKNIVVCCDGTGNEYGTHNTNVVTTFALAEESERQCRYYDPGVGTGGWVYEEERGTLHAAMDQATGHGLRRNVEEAYRFLMQVYEEGDRVYLFGFSRGAFTVRSLAGMLHRCGLLRPHAANLVEYASKLYHQEDAGRSDAAVDAGFRATFARPCPVHFIGVWDTVESLILNAGRTWHDTRLSPETAHAFQALAIDERRRDFPPCLWDESSVAPHQVLEQVWFAGVHSDVGGWYDERGLSNLALQWMLGKVRACGMHLDEDALADPRHQGDVLGTMHQSFSGFWRFRGSRRRVIPEGARVHRSVIVRMSDPGARYAPKLPERHTVVD